MVNMVVVKDNTSRVRGYPYRLIVITILGSNIIFIMGVRVPMHHMHFCNMITEAAAQANVIDGVISKSGRNLEEAFIVKISVATQIESI